jgi:cytochrome c6
MRHLLALAALALALGASLPAHAAVDAPALWKSKCASCHGQTGDAKTTMGQKHKVPDMSLAAWHEEAKHTDAWIKDIIENGVKDTKMKPFKEKLSGEEIDALVAFTHTLKAK